MCSLAAEKTDCLVSFQVMHQALQISMKYVCECLLQSSALGVSEDEKKRLIAERLVLRDNMTEMLTTQQNRIRDLDAAMQAVDSNLAANKRLKMEMVTPIKKLDAFMPVSNLKAFMPVNRCTASASKESAAPSPVGGGSSSAHCVGVAGGSSSAHCVGVADEIS